MVVWTTAPGYPPQITSTPPLYAAVNVAYPYTVTANDPQGGTITYTYTTSPSMSNFSVNSTTGVVTWTPNSTRGRHGNDHDHGDGHGGFDGGSELQRERGELAAADDLERDAAEHDHGRADVHLPGAGERSGGRHADLFADHAAIGHGDRPVGADHLGDDGDEHRRSLYLRSEGD